MTKRAFVLIGASVHAVLGAGALVLHELPARDARSRAPGEPYL